MSAWGIFGIVAILEWVVYLVWRTRNRVLPRVSRSQYARSPRETLIVHFPGLAGDPRTQIENVSWVFKERGSMAFVYYAGKTGEKARWFDPEGVVIETATYIASWRKRHPKGTVVLVGTSLGARLAYRTAAVLRQADISTKAILWDPPTGWGDLAVFQKFASIVGWVFYNAPVLHLVVFVQPLIRLLVQAPKDSQIEQKVLKDPKKRASLKNTVKVARRIKVPFYIGQSVSLLPRLPRGNPAGWTGYDVAVIRSEHCDVVSPTAFASWGQQIGGQQLPCFVAKGAYHAGSGLTPTAYIEPLRRALDWVLQNAPK